MLLDGGSFVSTVFSCCSKREVGSWSDFSSRIDLSFHEVEREVFFREMKRKKYLCGSWKSICFSNEFLLSEIDLVVNIYC